MENSNVKTKILRKILKQYIPEPITKTVVFKVLSLFNRNTPKQTVYGRRKKLSKPKTQKQSEENMTNNLRNPFILKQEKKAKKKLKIE